MTSSPSPSTAPSFPLQLKIQVVPIQLHILKIHEVKYCIPRIIALGTCFFFCSQGGHLIGGCLYKCMVRMCIRWWRTFPNITWFKVFYFIAHYATQIFCQKSDSALSSSCYGADFRGTRVLICSQLNSWALMLNRGRTRLRKYSYKVSWPPYDGCVYAGITGWQILKSTHFMWETPSSFLLTNLQEKLILVGMFVAWWYMGQKKGKTWSVNIW